MRGKRSSFKWSEAAGWLSPMTFRVGQPVQFVIDWSKNFSSLSRTAGKGPLMMQRVLSMVANLWSNHGMVTIHRYGLNDQQ